MSYFRVPTTVLVGGLALAMTAGSALAAETIKIGSQEPGGSFYSYAATFAKLIDENKAAGLTVEIIPRGGAFGNPTAVNKRIADFGFASSSTAAWARNGLEEVYKGTKAEDLRTVTGGLQAAYTMVIARKAYVEATGLKTLDEMVKLPNPPRIGLKPTGSQVPVIANMLLKSMGTSLADLRAKGVITQASAGQITNMITDGRLDVYIENAPAGQATVTEMTLTNDMVFLPFSEKSLSVLATEGLPTSVMPKNTFKDQTTDYTNPFTTTVLITNKNVADQVVYDVLKTLITNKGYIGEQHSALKSWDPVAGCQPANAVVPLHPGAVKLCKELGYLK